MKTRLASCNVKTGHITINRKLHGRDRQRVKRHMKTYVHERQKGRSYSASVAKARRVEHRGMTKKQIQRYEGRLGAIAKK